MRERCGPHAERSDSYNPFREGEESAHIKFYRKEVSVKKIVTEGSRVTIEVVPTGAGRTGHEHAHDGSHVYFGEFAVDADGRDLRHGLGVYVGTDFICEGHWVRNRMQGHGRKIYLSGQVYEGGFANDKKHGRGTYS